MLIWVSHSAAKSRPGNVAAPSCLLLCSLKVLILGKTFGDLLSSHSLLGLKGTFFILTQPGIPFCPPFQSHDYVSSLAEPSSKLYEAPTYRHPLYLFSFPCCMSFISHAQQDSALLLFLKAFYFLFSILNEKMKKRATFNQLLSKNNNTLQLKMMSL